MKITQGTSKKTQYPQNTPKKLPFQPCCCFSCLPATGHTSLLCVCRRVSSNFPSSCSVSLLDGLGIFKLLALSEFVETRIQPTNLLIFVAN